MNRQKRLARGFTLVELLVVIGIIALLIAILMPALSRARKQALAASCGSNARQIVYAALAYANDWKEALPTKGFPNGSVACPTGNPLAGLSQLARLPVIGFDTVTIWDWGTYVNAYTTWGDTWLGGLGFVMRDYMKNDMDIISCPDGWFPTRKFMNKWNGQSSNAYIGPAVYGPSGDVWSFPSSLNDWRTGYAWLPHRPISYSPLGGAYLGNWSAIPTDKAGDIAKTASDLPSLLMIADYATIQDRYYDVPGCPPNGSGGGTGCRAGLASNHTMTGYRGGPASESACMPCVFPPNIGREENPNDMPLGMNRGRIDARVTWLPWQDWRYLHYATYGVAMLWIF